MTEAQDDGCGGCLWPAQCKTSNGRCRVHEAWLRANRDSFKVDPFYQAPSVERGRENEPEDRAARIKREMADRRRQKSGRDDFDFEM